MSDQPFRELPDTNPYAPPASPVGSGSQGNPLLAPAIILLILSCWFMVLVLASLPGQIVRIRALDTSTPEGAGNLLGSIGSLTVWLLINVSIALGAIAMIRLTSYRSAYNAAICSVIPLCSPCLLLGIPFGIWAIILLKRPEVKRRFMRQ